MTPLGKIPAFSLNGSVSLPAVGLGTAGLEGRAGYEAIRSALDVGYRHLDTATAYRNEADVGRAVRDSGVARDEVFVTTKLPPRKAGRARETLDASLRELGLDYVDLWLIHWPPGEMSVETWRRFIEARDAGQVRAIGVSNYTLEEIDELTEATGEAPALNQVSWSPGKHDAEQLAEHRDRGVVLEGYSPLKGTDLEDPMLVEIAARYDKSPAQVVLRWHVDRGIAIIPKSTRKERIAANFDLFGFALDEDELSRIDQMPSPEE